MSTLVRVRGEESRDSLRILHAGIRQAAMLALRSAEQAAVDSAKATTLFKDKTGGTRGSIRMETTPALTGFVIAGGAAKFLEEGTPPHIIAARRAKMLRFVVDGVVMYRRWVRHPGTAERPFMTIARDIAERTAEYGAEYFVEQAIQRAH